MTKNKLVLVGEAPNRNGTRRPGEVLTGRSGRRLAELLGLEWSTYLRSTDRMNLLKRWPGSAGKGSKFDLRKAILSASKMVPKLEDRYVVLLGERVARAFGLHGEPTMEALEAVYSRPAGIRFSAIIVPHPSGVNRWWNDLDNEHAAKVALRRFHGDMVAGR